VATGGADPMVPAEQVGTFATEMQAAGVELQLMSFPGVKHGFTNPAATENGKKYDMPLAYDEYADKSSWQALLKFMR
jgi:dienelactone hydrolase